MDRRSFGGDQQEVQQQTYAWRYILEGLAKTGIAWSQTVFDHCENH